MSLGLGLSIGTITGAIRFTPFNLRQQFYTPTSTATIALLANNRGIFPDFEQTTGANQPSVSAGAISFDGSDYYENNAIAGSSGYLDPTTTHTLPDGLGSTSGKGIAPVGLTRDNSGNWWIANYGGGTQPSLMHTNSSFTKIKEVDLKAIDSAIGAIQGIVYEQATGYVWVASNGEGKIRVIDVENETNIATFTVDALPNGLAIDEANQRFFVWYGTTTLKSYNMSDGSYIETFSGLGTISGADHIFYDAETNIIWLTAGADSANNGKLYTYSINRGVVTNTFTQTDTDFARLNGSDAIEAPYLDFANNKLYVANDAYYKSSGNLLNNVQEYDFDASYKRAVFWKAYTELEYNTVLSVNAVTGSTRALWVLGRPVDAGAGQGLGLYIPDSGTDATGNTLRIIIHNGTTSETIDVALDVALTTKQQLDVKFDFANKRIAVLQNGVLQDTGYQAYSLAMTSVLFTKSAIAATDTGSRATAMVLYDYATTDQIRSIADNNKLGNYWATKNSLTWTDTITPAALSDKVMWLNANDSATITESGGAVSAWVDKFNNGNNALEVTAAQNPITDSTALNGKNVIVFDGADDTLKTAAFASEITVPNTIMIVGTNTLDGDMLHDGLTSSKRHVFQNSAGVLAAYAGTNLASATALDANPHVFVNTFGGVSDGEMRLDGTSIATGTTGTQALDGLTLGARHSGGANINGYIAEVVIGDMSAAEKAQMEQYAKLYWRL